MPAPRTPLDPEGYYARLGVEPYSKPEDITAAYRRQARMLHPDVPSTGDAGAFMALKQAYDVLIHAKQRAAYDRQAQAEAARQEAPRPDAPRRAMPDEEPGEIGPVPFPQMATAPTRHPRLRDLPVMVWAGMAVILLVGAIEITLHLTSGPAQSRREPIPATAREVPPPGPAEMAQPSYGPAPVRLAGTPNFYIVP
jgi:curved DNA-binding protein CbpA